MANLAPPFAGLPLDVLSFGTFDIPNGHPLFEYAIHMPTGITLFEYINY